MDATNRIESPDARRTADQPRLFDTNMGLILALGIRNGSQLTVNAGPQAVTRGRARRPFSAGRILDDRAFGVTVAAARHGIVKGSERRVRLRSFRRDPIELPRAIRLISALTRSRHVPQPQFPYPRSVFASWELGRRPTPLRRFSSRRLGDRERTARRPVGREVAVDPQPSFHET